MVGYIQECPRTGDILAPGRTRRVVFLGKGAIWTEKEFGIGKIKAVAESMAVPVNIELVFSNQFTTP